jgi:hypothetical protein
VSRPHITQRLLERLRLQQIGRQWPNAIKSSRSSGESEDLPILLARQKGREVPAYDSGRSNDQCPLLDHAYSVSASPAGLLRMRCLKLVYVAAAFYSL